MDIDYDLLAQKIKDKLMEDKPKPLTGRAYWRSLRKSKDRLDKNDIAPESGAPLVSMEDYETIVKEGRNFSYKECKRLQQAIIDNPTAFGRNQGE